MQLKKFFKIGWLALIALIALATLLVVMSVSAQTERNVPSIVIKGAVQSEPVVPSLSRPARELPLAFVIDTSAPAIERSRRITSTGSMPGSSASGIDPYYGSFSLNPTNSQRAFNTPILNFDGQGFSGVNPSDNVGDVGPLHYVQAINGAAGSPVTIYNKEDGTVATGPFLMETLATSGACTDGVGDPIVNYDQFADRWVLSEFSGAANALCVYVSETSDPTGAYFAYQFNTPNFPDYPKYGVWPDAYYVTTNEGSPAVYALDRTAMLAGTAATSQRLTAPPLAGWGFNALTPADADGDLEPPAGAPGLMMRHRDDEIHNPGTANATEDYVEVWEFDVDWTTPANSTLTKAADVPMAEFDSELCDDSPPPGGSAFNCFEQPGTTTLLDAVREVIMWRVQYRNFGDYQTMVGNFVVDVDDTDRGGVRWYEVRDNGSGWGLHQAGTVTAADDVNRWMGSIAMDKFGNIALGYDITSATTTFPSVRYTGRLASDTLGEMTQGEIVVINGTDSNASVRWGDYNSMNVDPVDDCTFWFTSNYSPAPQWATRIVVFQFDECAGAVGTPTATPTTDPNITPTATETGTPDANLIDNPGFEAKDANNEPDLTPWVVKNETGDKIKCNKDKDGDGIPDKIFSHTGDCAFRFKGFLGENGKLTQTVDLAGLTFVSGDTLDLSVWVDAPGTPTAKIKLRVKYSDATEKGKLNIDIATSTGYTELTGTLPLASSAVENIKFSVNHKTTSGKVYIDDVTLLLLTGVSPTAEPTGTATVTLLPLP
jgi:hypothetical protein